MRRVAFTSGLLRTSIDRLMSEMGRAGQELAWRVAPNRRRDAPRVEGLRNVVQRRSARPRVFHGSPRASEVTARRSLSSKALKCPRVGAVAELVGIEGGVVSGVINLESSGVEASDWRPRHDEHYHEA